MQSHNDKVRMVDSPGMESFEISREKKEKKHLKDKIILLFVLL